MAHRSTRQHKILPRLHTLAHAFRKRTRPPGHIIDSPQPERCVAKRSGAEESLASAPLCWLSVHAQRALDDRTDLVRPRGRVGAGRTQRGSARASFWRISRKPAHLGFSDSGFNPYSWAARSFPQPRAGPAPSACRHVGSNQLSGTIPASLGSLSSLQMMCAPRAP